MSTHAKYMQNELHGEKEIAQAVKVVAEAINAKYKGEAVLLITILKGGVNFSCDLQKHLTMDCEIEYAVAKSYGAKGKFQDPAVSQMFDFSVTDKHVIIVDDIIDTGGTMSEVVKQYHQRKPKSIAVAAMIKFPRAKITTDFPVEGFYCWEEQPGGYLYGYGLDLTERQLFRNLPFIAVCKKEFMQSDAEKSTSASSNTE